MPDDTRSADQVAGDDAIAKALDLLPGTVSRYTWKLGQRVAAEEVERAADLAPKERDEAVSSGRMTAEQADAAYRKRAEQILAESKKLSEISSTDAATSGLWEKIKTKVTQAAIDPAGNVGTLAVGAVAIAGIVYLVTRKSDDG